MDAFSDEDVFKLYSSDEEKEDEIKLPGFRFHRTDEELLEFHLRGKVEKKPADFTWQALDKELSENRWENLSRKMYRFFKNENYRNKMKTDLSWASLYEDDFGAQVSAEFLEGLGDFKSLKYSKFEALMTCNRRMHLASSLYRRYKWMEDELFVETHREGIYKIKKEVAITESELFKDLVKHTGGGGRIPVGVSSDILSKAIDFMKMEFSFRKQLERHKDSIASFLKNNQNILPDLYQVAEYLKIPSLLNLTSLVSCRIRSMADSIWESKVDFNKFFKNFQDGYKGSVRAFVKAKNAVISDLYQAANLADMSFSECDNPVKGMKRHTLDDILDCYTKLTFA